MGKVDLIEYYSLLFNSVIHKITRWYLKEFSYKNIKYNFIKRINYSYFRYNSLQKDTSLICLVSH